MSKLAIGILGLGRIGTSIGLALRRYMNKGGKYTFTITGYDSRDEAQKTASMLKAVDRIEGRLFNAVREKDIIIVALPYDEVKGMYQYIKQDLRDGTVLLDTSPIKKPSMAWAAQYLTEEHHVIGFTPVINTAYLFDALDDAKTAHEDLFDKGHIIITPSKTSVKEAVELATNFAILLGAATRFMDLDEHDALVTFTESMPSLLGVAVYYAAMTNHGWNDIQRLVNPSMGAMIHHLFDTHPDALRDLWLQNAPAIIRNLDDLIAILTRIRQLLATEDRDALEAFVIRAADDYQAWFNRRYRADWGDVDHPQLEAPSLMASFLGGSIAKRLRGDKSEA